MRALETVNQKLVFIEDRLEPSSRRGEVKVQVNYASLNPTDIDIIDGKLDLFLRLNGTNSPVRTGLEFSGTVLESGGRFEVGARVCGYTHLFKGPKTHQDVICVPDNYIVAMPDKMSLAEGAAFPLGAQTSLVALRQIAKLKAGQSILINGASGGLGLFAIQIARNMGVEVTAIAGPAGQHIMSKLGATRVINYEGTALSEIEELYDAVLGLTKTARFKDVRHLLKPKGIYIPAEPQIELASLLLNPFRSQKVGYLFVDHGDAILLRELVKDVVDDRLTVGNYREFPFEEFEFALEALKAPGRIGRVVLRLR